MITKLLNYFRTTVTDNISYVEEDNPSQVINGIGEPVLSFVRCFKDNPKRFSLTPLVLYTKLYQEHYIYLLTDNLTGKSYTWRDEWEVNNLYRGVDISDKYGEHYNLEGVITEAEGLYVRKVLTDYYTERLDRLTGLKERRSKRKSLLDHQNNVKMRNDLMEVYCNG